LPIRPGNTAEAWFLNLVEWPPPQWTNCLLSKKNLEKKQRNFFIASPDFRSSLLPVGVCAESTRTEPVDKGEGFVADSTGKPVVEISKSR